MAFAFRAALIATGLAVLAADGSARADTGAVFVVPGRLGYPVAINGCDASWMVVEGDIGLARPGHLTPTILGPCKPLRHRYSHHRNPYFPRYGLTPARGRNEVDPGPDRPMPEPAESFYRSWSTSSDSGYIEKQSYKKDPRYSEPTYERRNDGHAGSDQLPATIDDGQPPFQPPIVVVPTQRGYRR